MLMPLQPFYLQRDPSSSPVMLFSIITTATTLTSVDRPFSSSSSPAARCSSRQLVSTRNVGSSRSPITEPKRPTTYAAPSFTCLETSCTLIYASCMLL
ncbi:hypothetical protein LXL04_024406 [Taraxacum kok-saghyz]